jgi:regulatory protein
VSFAPLRYLFLFLPILIPRSTLSLLLYFIASLPHSSVVFTSTKKVDTEQELYNIALRALMRRPHSVKEMQRLLDRRASHKLLAQVVMARMKENGQLDDARYAQQFTRQRTEIRRQGKYRIARDLRARGVSDADIQAAVDSNSDDESQRAAIRHRIERKLKLSRGEISDNKIASLYRSLLAAGFPSDAIRRELKSITTEDVPAVDPDDPAASDL